MEKQFLVYGVPSRLTIDIAHECLSRKHRVLLTLEPDTAAPPIPAGLEDRLQYVDWNRRSAISARLVLMQAMNKQVQIDHAILVHTPIMDRTIMHDASAAYFEERLDFDLKGYLFIIKELLSYFLKQGKGGMTFLLQNPGPEVLPPMDALCMKAMEGLVESVLTYYSQEPIVLRGLTTRNTQHRQLTEQVLKIILEDSVKTRGKMVKLNQKLQFFGFGLRS
jgi:hypothetical protein